MANAFASIAQGLQEAIDLNEGKAIAAHTHRPEETDVAKLCSSLGLTEDDTTSTKKVADITFSHFFHPISL